MSAPVPAPRARARALPADATRAVQHPIAVTVTPRAAGERAVAEEVLALVRARAEARERCVLGLATGGTMVGVYAALVSLAREQAVSFSHVSSVNLDEYLGLGPSHPQSFAAFMHENLFRHLGFASTHVPDGVRAAEEPVAVAREVEAHIRALGGIDLQLLGLGRNGHLAFNEPGAAYGSRARVVALARETREDAAASFGGLALVPRRALTLGLGTILEARALRVLAFGAKKAAAVAAALRGPATRGNPAAALRRHPDVRLWVDAEAARFALPGRGPEVPA